MFNCLIVSASQDVNWVYHFRLKMDHQNQLKTQPLKKLLMSNPPSEVLMLCSSFPITWTWWPRKNQHNDAFCSRGSHVTGVFGRKPTFRKGRQRHLCDRKHFCSGMVNMMLTKWDPLEIWFTKAESQVSGGAEPQVYYIYWAACPIALGDELASSQISFSKYW